ncbi:3-deoxy-manno-octulosonate cytidylyltransferase [Legionella jordanis]|uniref:3-deoxy-manno-octulosonate cytidylyltransferase n=1 Tax=Legionella jordanis TaxID=456 RepID=UPI000EFE5D15|nr:3-deoxy-manno-octulosonate cytidylyltransferase [Legionella jordanis]RMX20837.1 3-deoxy-manno-octulosonate cytidylyltransferase [Legionella jordanis]
MKQNFHIIIPARYQSTRLPGKLMMEVQGLTVLERVYKQALKANPKSIIIATDHELIAQHAEDFGAQVKMTSPYHQTGTDRIAEVAADAQFSKEEIIVNVQGDEPFISPKLIQQVANSLAGSDTAMASLCWPIETPEQLLNPNVVKVVRDYENNALYFSRSAIPFNRDCPNDSSHVFRHIGLYAYRVGFLLDFVKWPACDLEKVEALEQLRALWKGYKIRVETAVEQPLQDINTEEDLALANRLASEYFMD